MFKFITPAYAQSIGGSSISDLTTLIVPFALMFAIMWFMVLRPQQERAKQQAQMLAAIKRGDTVVTAGGIIAKVARVKDDAELLVDIAEGTQVRVLRSMITEVRVKGEPVKEKT